jgi:hypothetical protein
MVAHMDIFPIRLRSIGIMMKTARNPAAPPFARHGWGALGCQRRPRWGFGAF